MSLRHDLQKNEIHMDNTSLVCLYVPVLQEHKNQYEFSSL